MKILALALLLILRGATAASAAGDDLVDAAKEAKSNRKKSTTKVITNKDVKKAKAVLGTTNAPTTPVEAEPTLAEKAAAEKAARAAAEEKLAKAEKVVAELEASLAAIEQEYYEEDDLTRRDTVIVQRFNEVKAKLDAAKRGVGVPPAPAGHPAPPQSAPGETPDASARDARPPR
jgi:hypothetical protein